jgi:hypothetical protein
MLSLSNLRAAVEGWMGGGSKGSLAAWSVLDR